ncbi:hypothetical protein ARALYDRAFT_357625 [Arabidopsis lyrata subsp. lyrata]|uniref:Calcineurin-like phosphoesterase domain-containing protein n=1 Tax=Arabidopsis lyrata subsp. lyrata TaxID=81972 RepID=D7MTJ4_ARALL|nr:hypothetical protein ARALYDRAFT_357625 [Arabidopsis lyrata subsp. lyrata]
MEKDEIRRHDSFKAFKEICSIAEEKQVNFLLLGGDIFHENKPSRTTLVKAIEILRRHCLNYKPVHFQVVSDQTVNFQNAFGHVNHEDPHFNVGLPVFSIHGNHDDPARVVHNLHLTTFLQLKFSLHALSLQLMVLGVAQISLYPILMSKETSGMNVSIECLRPHPHAAQWMRPEVQEGGDVSDWVKSKPKNAISEHFLPRFLDFIVSGHEHECLIDRQVH